MGSQRNPAAATNGSVVMVVWDDEGLDGTKRIQAQRFSPDGIALDPAPVDLSSVQELGGKPRHPAVAALPQGGFLVAWESKANGITVGNVSATGNLTFQQIFRGAGTDVEIASDGTRFLVVWEYSDQLTTAKTLALRVEIDALGVAVAGAALELAQGVEPVVAGGNGLFFLSVLKAKADWSILRASSWPPEVVSQGAFDASRHAVAADGSGIVYSFWQYALPQAAPKVSRISWSGTAAEPEALPAGLSDGAVEDLAVALSQDGVAIVSAQVTKTSPNEQSDLWLWTLMAGNSTASPLLLNGISHAQQDPELLPVAGRFWILWEDRRIDFLGNGKSSDQEDIYVRFYRGATSPSLDPECLLTGEFEAAPVEPVGLISDGQNFKAMFTQRLASQPLPGLTLRRVWEADSAGAAQVVGFAAGEPKLVTQSSGYASLWDYVPYRPGNFGMQFVRRDAAGRVTGIGEIPGWRAAGSVFGGAGERYGILTRSSDSQGNSHISAGRGFGPDGSPYGSYLEQIEEYPAVKQPLAFLFAGERSMALWREGAAGAVSSRLRFRRFKDLADGSWATVDLIPQTLPEYNGEFSDAVGVAGFGQIGPAYYFAKKTARLATVEFLPVTDYSYPGQLNQIFSYLALEGTIIKEVKLLPAAGGAVVLILESKTSGGSVVRAQRLYAPSFTLTSYTSSVLWETGEDLEFVAAAANEFREIQVLLKTDDPLIPARRISLQVESPVIRAVKQGFMINLEISGETGWQYLIEESQDLLTWNLSGSVLPTQGLSTWSQGFWHSKNFFRAR